MWHCMLVFFHRFTTVAAVVTGFVSVRLWYKSAQVSSDPFMGGVESGEESTAQGQWIAAILCDSMEVARLNRKAALMTAWSVGIGAAATILGTF